MGRRSQFLSAILFVIPFLNNLYFCKATIAALVPGAIYQNVAYGSDPRQIMDVYLPEGRNSSVSKVFVLIHGGGWQSGSKEDFDYIIPGLHAYFPHHVIANLNYRLGSVESPAFPKQIQDIATALQFLKDKSAEFDFQSSFGLIGNSAGGHLALLYGYGFDSSKDVKVIWNTVGPVDMTDPSYTANSNYTYAFFPLVGNFTYKQNPELYRQVSPVYYVTKESPNTISFYGNADPLIPTAQGKILEDKLDSVGVCNKYYLYNAGHGDFSPEDSQHMVKKVVYFFNNYFP